MELLEKFKSYYCEFDQRSIKDIGCFYADNICFSDPVHHLEGLKNLQRYFEQMCRDLLSCRFEFVAETVDKNTAWFKWVMYYQHPRILKGELLSLNGVSIIQFAETEAGQKIINHEDFYDMGAMLYEHTPLLGIAIRWLKKQLSKNE
jgi:hypothetical protein